jgi:hypothetical protein
MSHNFYIAEQSVSIFQVLNQKKTHMIVQKSI